MLPASTYETHDHPANETEPSAIEAGLYGPTACTQVKKGEKKVAIRKTLQLLYLGMGLSDVFCSHDWGTSSRARDGREIGEGDTKRSHLLASPIKDEFSAPQSGVRHFQTRRNGYG